MGPPLGAGADLLLELQQELLTRTAEQQQAEQQPAATLRSSMFLYLLRSSEPQIFRASETVVTTGLLLPVLRGIIPALPTCVK